MNLKPPRHPGASPRRLPARPGFTLVELAVAIGIIVLLAAITVPVILQLGKGRGTRDASRIVQAALTGARDQAMARNTAVGIRLLPDDNDPTICRSLIYIEPAPSYGSGTAHVVRPVNLPSGATPAGPMLDPAPTLLAQDDAVTGQPAMLVVPAAGASWARFNNGGLIRFEFAGSYYPFTWHQRATAGEIVLLLRDPFSLTSNPLPAPAFARGVVPTYANLTGPTATGIRYQLFRDDVAPVDGAEPVNLPRNVLIDLKLSQLQRNSDTAPIDIVFAPNGTVLPPQSRYPYVVLWVRDAEALTQDVTTALGPPPVVERYVRAIDSAGHSLIAVGTQHGYATTTRPYFVDADADSNMDPERYFNNITRGDVGTTQ